MCAVRWRGFGVDVGWRFGELLVLGRRRGRGVESEGIRVEEDGREVKRRDEEVKWRQGRWKNGSGHERNEK